VPADKTETFCFGLSHPRLEADILDFACEKNSLLWGKVKKKKDNIQILP